MNDKEEIYTIEFNGFEGSVNDLIKNIKDDKLDINDVPIINIIKCYIDYIFSKKESIDINVVSKTISYIVVLLKNEI